MDGAMIPLGQLAKVVVPRVRAGIRTENALLSAYIYVDIRDRDIGGYVADAKKAVAEQVKFPPGYYATWSGQFEYMERAIEKMKVVIPVTLLIIFLLLYLNFRRITETLIVMLSVPFALVGGVWLMWWLGYNLSVAVAVGFIALAGVAAETGVIMLIYLDHAWEAIKRKMPRRRPRTERRPTSTPRSWKAPSSACGPKMMTVVAIMAGLLPIMWGTGTGSEVMSRIAAPMVGGMISSTVLTLAVIPAIYALVKQWLEFLYTRYRCATAVLRPKTYPPVHTAAEALLPDLVRSPADRYDDEPNKTRSLRGWSRALLSLQGAQRP
jgi:Cu(I)/Ag(I) efflux system membrane protein CusA/SilA